MEMHQESIDPITQARGQALVTLLELITQIVNPSAPVLLIGPAGSGRNLVVRAMHAASIREDSPLLWMNCQRRPLELRKDSLQGELVLEAAEDFVDLASFFRAAGGGTLVVDQVDGLSLELQALLLDTLEDQRVEHTPDNLPTRVLATSQVNLETRVTTHQFRHDLYLRLNVVTLELPELLARHEDFAVVLNLLLTLRGQETSVAAVPPGWAHLQETLERALRLRPPGALWEQLLPLMIRLYSTSRSSLLRRKDIGALRRVVETSLQQHEQFGGDLYDALIRQLERNLLQTVLLRCNGAKTRAAEILGLSLVSFNQKLRQLGLEHGA